MTDLDSAIHLSILAVALYLGGILAWLQFIDETRGWHSRWNSVLFALAWPVWVLGHAAWRIAKMETGEPFNPPPYTPKRPPPSVTVTVRTPEAVVEVDQPIRAYRQWMIKLVSTPPPEYALYSVAIDHFRWCPITHADQAPEFEECAAVGKGHGLYAMPLVAPYIRPIMRFDHAHMWYLPSAEGEVELMGRVIRHEYGYRAETARVVSIKVRDLHDHWDTDEVIDSLARRYQCDVEVLPFADLEHKDLMATPNGDEGGNYDPATSSTIMTMDQLTRLLTAADAQPDRLIAELRTRYIPVMHLSNCVILGGVNNGYR